MKSLWVAIALACSINAQSVLKSAFVPVDPALDFSLRFQAGYGLKIPLTQFQGTKAHLDVLLRITPDHGEPAQLSSALELPSLKVDAPREIEVSGGFLVGEGHYAVDATLSDGRGGVCRGNWIVDAKRPHNVELHMARRTAAELGSRSARASSPARIDRLTLFVHAAPFSQSRLEIGTADLLTLTDLISSTIEELPATTVRVVVFNWDRQEVLFRADPWSDSSMMALIRRLNELQLSRIDAQVLRSASGAAEFLANLLRESSDSNVTVFLGGPARLDPTFPRGLFPKSSERVFYLQYGVAKSIAVSPVPADRVSMNPDTSANPNSSGDLPPPLIQPANRFPATVSRSDPVEALVSRLGGKTIVLREPADLAKAAKKIIR